MNYDKLYGEAEAMIKKGPQKGPLVLPDTKDLKEIAQAGIDALLPQLIQDAYLSDNIPQKMSVLKECLDRRHGKAEQSVSAKVEVSRGPDVPMQRVAAMIAMSMKKARELPVIDVL
jgi:hypothetical protein